MAYGQMLAFTPLYLPKLGIAESEVPFWIGAITSISNFIGLPFLPFWGALADRYGRKPLIVRSLVTGFVAFALTVVAPNVFVFTLARAVQALGLGNTGLMLATLAEHTPRKRIAFAFGVVNGAVPLGGSIGPLIGGPIVDRFGFTFLMAVDAVMLAGVVALLVFGYHDGFVPRATGSLLRSAADGALLIVRSPRLRALFPALFVLFAGWLIAYIYTPLVVQKIYGGTDPATAVGIVFGAAGLVTLFASPGVGSIADRFGHLRTLFATGTLMIGLWFLPFFARDLLPFGILFAITNGVETGLFGLSFNVLASSTNDATRGRVMTFGYLPSNIGFVIGPAIGSYVASIDVFLVFPAAAALTAVGLVMVAYASRQRVLVDATASAGALRSAQE